ncbi:hypothetical protein H6H02_06325 [Coleofasciculus sp. FACHB-1120]|nr:hypothetical protein [Coleofasciculus sp. FACHB-1120]
MMLDNRGNNVTDHLEPYRRMVRSIRFVPALGPTHPSHQQPVMPLPPVNLSLSVPSAPLPASEVAPDPSEHVTGLVQEAVSKPTVLPVTYAIAENLGDRISRLAPAKPTRSQPPEIIAFKIPQPDPKWKPAPPVPGWEKPVDASSTAPTSVAAPEVEPPSSSVPEREVAPVPEPVEETPSALPEAISKAPTTAPEVSAPTEETPVAEAGSPEEAIAPIEEPEDTQKDTQQPSLLDRAAAALQAVVSVFDQADAEQKEPAVEPAPPEVEAETSAATPAPVEQIPRQSEVETETPTAETPVPTQPAEETAAESSEEAIAPKDEPDAPQPTLLDRAASALEAVVSVFNQQPEADDQNEQAVESAPESAPAPAPSVPELETPQIICPKCGAPEIRKNGHYKNKQRYVCKDCGKQFVAADAVEEAEAQKQASVTSEAQESPKTEKTDSVPTVPEKASKGKGKKPAKGFGRPNKK